MKSPVDPNEKASAFPSGRGHSGGSALSHRIDNPDRRTGEIPIRTSGGPSSSPDVTASQLMQSYVMNDDDIKWYKELFEKMHDDFLKPRFTVQPGFDVGLNCSVDISGDKLYEDIGTDHRLSSYGVFIPLPISTVRKIESVYPKCRTRAQRDDSPMHITLVYIGDIQESQASFVRNIVDEVVASYGEFVVSFDGTSHFVNDDGNVFYINVASSELHKLHDAIKGALVTAGISVSDHPQYHPHVTLSYLPPEQFEDKIAFAGSFLVDRVELWNMSSPTSLYLNDRKSCCLSCSMGTCFEHVDRYTMLLDDEPKLPDEEKQQEVNVVAGGAISGYTLPLGRTNLSKKKRKKRLTIAAHSFGGAK